MTILITSGGTAEKIDEVRKITNMSTGKLGATIANELVSLDDVKIIFLSNEKLELPKPNHKIEIVNITDTNSVLINMESIIKNNKIDFVIHCMAISDYTVETVFNENNIKKFFINTASKVFNTDVNESIIKELTKEFIGQISGIDNSKKISSNFDNLFIKLTKTPKIVDMIKQLDQNISLISFKLLNGVPEEELINVARKQLKRTNSDMVIANDLTNIKNGNHRALFVKEFDFKIVEGKEFIARNILYFINNKRNK